MLVIDLIYLHTVTEVTMACERNMFHFSGYSFSKNVKQSMQSERGRDGKGDKEGNRDTKKDTHRLEFY